MSGTTRSTCHMPHATCCQFSSPDCALFCCQSVWQLLKLYIVYIYGSKLMAVMQAVEHECVSHHVHTDTQRVFRGIFTCNIQTFKVKRRNILEYFMH